MRRPITDFLIVVALADEFEAVARQFGPLTTSGREHFCTVPRKQGGEYRVAILNIGDMGPAAAQRETSAALTRIRTSRVLLVGIAAGFPEEGVRFGDLMIPQWIADYEKAKVREERTAWWKKRKPVVDHRGNAEKVSQSLLHTAQTIAESPAKEWADRITIPRPDHQATPPTVFAKADSVLGSGSKIVASELFEARQWLRSEHRGILGLEMESIGVVQACQSREAQVLVLKSSQDPATALKDSDGNKDQWRAYACDVAAAFARELVGAYEASADSIIAQHIAKLDIIIKADLARESPQFEYLVDLAQSYSDVKRRQFQAIGQPLESILPNDGSPLVALLGGGGTGKSNIAKRLIRRIKANDQCPLLFDLSRYELSSRKELRSREWSDLETAERERIASDLLEKLIKQTSMPQHSLQDIQVLANEADVVAILDGLNEVPPVEQALFLDLLKQMGGTSRTKIIVTARFGDREAFADFKFASVAALGRKEVKNIYDRFFKKGDQSAYDRLEPQVQEILRRPFFLSLAMRGQELLGLRNWSEIFERFFEERLRIGSEQLDAIAEAAFLSLDAVGGIDVEKFKTSVGNREYQHAVDAEVISRDERGFDHELWRDFLASRHLSKHPELWIDAHFDRVTVRASSYESLVLTMEQINSADQRDIFVKAVYDWNLPGAVACLEYGNAGTGEVTRGLKIAILAAIADRSFDPVYHSRVQANAQLAEQPSDEAKRFAATRSRSELVEAIQTESVLDPWFDEWFSVFGIDATPVSDDIVDLVRSDDSIIGWAAANALKRVALTSLQQIHLRDIYQAERPDGLRAVRWRVVHALGSFSEQRNIDLLEEALKSDPYMWVRYGAARSLMEIAAGAEEQTRTRAFASLRRAIPSVRTSTVIDRHKILRQIIGSAQNSNARGAWMNDVRPTLEFALEYADTSRRQELDAMMERVRSQGVANAD